MPVYFVQGGRFIKIGFASHYHARIRELQVNSPIRLTLLAVIEGDIAVERAYHARFAHLRKRNEWFLYNAELRDFIEREVPTLQLDRRGRDITWKGPLHEPNRRRHSCQ